MCNRASINRMSARNVSALPIMLVVYGLALLAGGVLPLAFAPLGWYWLAVLSPAVLFLLAVRLPKRAALCASYFFGLGYFGVGVSWVFISINRYGSGPVAALLVTVGFVALLALFPWSVVFLVRTLSARMELLSNLVYEERS